MAEATTLSGSAPIGMRNCGVTQSGDHATTHLPPGTTGTRGEPPDPDPGKTGPERENAASRTRFRATRRRSHDFRLSGFGFCSKARGGGGGI